MATVYIKEVPEKVRNEFKGICAKEGVSMKDAIIQYMELVVKAGKIKV